MCTSALPPLRPHIILISCLFLLLSCQQKPQAEPQYERILLPNGWSITDVGKTLPLADLPLNLVVSPDQSIMAVNHSGHGTQYLQLYDLNTHEKLSQIEMPKSWLGLAFHPTKPLLYASGGNDNMIRVYQYEGKTLSLTDSILLGKPWPEEKILVAGISIDPSGNTLYTVTREDSALYLVDLTQNQLSSRIALPHEPYTCYLSPNRSELYISYWTGASVGIWDLENAELSTSIAVGSNPNDLLCSPDGHTLYVANANDNSVSVIDLDSRKILETLSTSLYPNAPTGSTPNGLALDPSGTSLYIANADNNCLAVFDVQNPGESHSRGFIPTGWYPSDVEVVDNTLYVSNGKGSKGLIANPQGPQAGIPTQDREQYIGRLYKGSLSIIPIPNEEVQHTYTQLVYENTPYSKEKELLAEGTTDNPIPQRMEDSSPIKYVFYFVKENRTYDQLFGDIPEGNGDSSLCLFPEWVSPNHHKLAREFVLLDNFYVDAEVSQDGHNWSSGAYAPDYVEKQWPTTYSGRGGSFNYYAPGSHPKEGYIWDFCEKAGVSWRNYGMFVQSYGTIAFEDGVRGKVGIPSVENHTYLGYPGYNLDFLDVDRQKLWAEDFDSLVAAKALPQFNSIRIGNDHTYGARVGKRTPRAMVADNDLALGKFVDHISHSPIWEESAIFVLEDDAQNGPDHVDAHRSVALVISPYTRRKAVDHTLYTTSSMLRTMELILGIPPMSQFDAAATPMWNCFQETPDLTPYAALPANIDLEERNQDVNAMAELSESFDWSQVDNAPDHLFSEVIWKTVKGMNSPMPAPKRSAFIQLIEKEEEEGE